MLHNLLLEKKIWHNLLEKQQQLIFKPCKTSSVSPPPSFPHSRLHASFIHCQTLLLSVKICLRADIYLSSEGRVRASEGDREY